MKKKLIALLLAVSACVSMTGCEAVSNKLSGLPIIGGWFNKNDTDPATTYDLEGAKTKLESEVKTKNAESREEYAVPASFKLLDVTYTVEWSVNVDSVKLEKDGDKVYVNVYEASLSFEDVPFVLTAKIIAPDGTSIETKMNRIVPKLERFAPAKISQKPAEDVVYRLNAYSPGKGQDLYFAGETKSAEYWYYLKTTDEYNRGKEVYAEHVDGSEDEFYLYHLKEVSEGEPTKEYINIIKSGTHINAQLSTTPVALKFGTEHNTFYRNIDGDDCILVTEKSFGTIGGALASKVGTDVRPAYLVTEVDRMNVSEAEKMEYEKSNLNLAKAYVSGGDAATITTHGFRFPDVKITWATNSEAVSIKRTALSFNATETVQEVTVTATLTIGATTETKDFTFNVIPNTEEAILTAAAAFESGQAFGNDVTLTGVITSIDSAYDATHNNVTFTMKVGETMVEGYRMKGDGADVLAPGYTVTCSGKFMNYSGKLEFSSGKIESYVEGTLPDNGGEDTSLPTIAEVVAAC